MLPFRQVDVFSAEPWLGNPLAVVHDADGLGDEQMARFARWTNLSETTFLCAPTDPRADYRVRIWTTSGELPFAGHPTIGSAHAWLEAGGVPRGEGLVQECGAGLVDVRRQPGLGFAAPPLQRSGPVEDDLRARIVRALGVPDGSVADMAWIDNGPGWVGVDLGTAEAVLAVEPDIAAFTDLKVTVLGRWDEAGAREHGADVEVRAFLADGRDFAEDPVTGSANAGLAQWLIGSGALPAGYTSRQGSVIGREGRVRLEAVDERVWVSGDAVTRIVGAVELDHDGSMTVRRVSEVMLHAPIVLAASDSVEEVREVLSSSHVHMVLVTASGRVGEPLLGTLVRDDLPEPGSAAPGGALAHARLAGRTVRAELPAEDARTAMRATGQRRQAVVDADGRLLGLLCLKRSGDGFCTDAGVASRRAARIEAPRSG